MLAFLSSIYILSFKDYALNTYEILLNDDQTIRLIIERTDLVAIADSLVVFYNITLAFISISILLYVIHLETTSDSLLKIIPTFNNVIGEMIYKATFLLFTSILGKNISNKEFFIQINTIFFFLIISNLQGMIPYMFTLTSALTNTFFIALALFISILITILDKKGMNYFLNLFMPPGCPIALIFLLIPIEVISYSFRVVSLSVRLFANMMAGHTLLKVIVGFS